MLFRLLLLVLIIYTLYFFYTDLMNKINTNKPFAEGMTNTPADSEELKEENRPDEEKKVDVSMSDGATNDLEQNTPVPQVTTEKQQIIQTPVYQQAVNQISSKNSNYQMANGNVITAPTGNCPNGCKAPQYDNERCSNQILAGKAYRYCPWIGDGSINDSMCIDCGSVLFHKINKVMLELELVFLTKKH